MRPPKIGTNQSDGQSGRGGLDADLTAVARSLHSRYDARLSATTVDTEIQAVADRFKRAKIRSFVPLFVHRYAGGELHQQCDSRLPVPRAAAAPDHEESRAGAADLTAAAP